MIFVTVGTHEQPFDRLLKCIDKMVENGVIKEEVIAQKGYTDYNPRNYKAYVLIPYEQMQEYMKKARIIITHGGPASFLDPLRYQKIAIVVPRRKEFNEHVNNHQVEFCNEVVKRLNNIIVAESDRDIENAIKNYDQKVRHLSYDNKSNNEKFNNQLVKEIEKIL